MVSQRTMQRIWGPRTCLVGLTAALLLYAACGQNEGGRCQVTSDCASGLICNNNTGNGQCVSPNAVFSTNDAALANDAPEGQPDVSGPELGIDGVVTPESDAEALDSEAVTLDAGTVDSASQASTDSTVD